MDNVQDTGQYRKERKRKRATRSDRKEKKVNMSNYSKINRNRKGRSLETLKKRNYKKLSIVAIVGADTKGNPGSSCICVCCLRLLLRPTDLREGFWRFGRRPLSSGRDLEKLRTILKDEDSSAEGPKQTGQ
jgi:hypothetical protein